MKDKKEGFGIYSWPDGKQYQGFWSNGLQDGIGRFTNTKGQSRVGKWKEGKRLEWVKDQEEQNALKTINVEAMLLEEQESPGMQSSPKYGE